MSDRTDAQPTDTKPADLEKQQQDEADLLKAQRDEMKLSSEAFDKQRSDELEDLKFEAGEHWTPADVEARKLKHKPTFTIDHISGQIQQVTNQPVHRIVVTAVGRDADTTSAEYWQGYCRRVENLSNAEDVYKWARMHAAKMGRGFWRIRPDVFDPPEFQPGQLPDASIFNQDLRIEPILNQHSVYEDPRCRMLDFSDARFCNIGEDLEWATIKRLYPKAEDVNADTVRAEGDCPAEWANDKTGRVIERYWIEDQVVTVCMLPDGQIVIKDDKQQEQYQSGHALKEHTFRVPRVRWMKTLAGAMILEGPLDVPGRYIPIVKIVGERRMIDGKEYCRGMVRMAKDPARLLDFMETRLAETVDLATVNTWMVAAEATAGMTEWDDLADGKRPSVLRWNSTDPNDPNRERLPKPEHISTAPIVAPIVAAATRAEMNLRHVLGTPDVQPDERRQEQSGKAIGLRLQQQQQSTSHYSDSTAGGIRLTGRILMSMGRQILDVPQVLRIMGTDEQPMELVAYKGGDPARDQMAQQMATQPQQNDPQAKARAVLRVDVGQFDVDVTAGKGYQTGRQEAVENLTAMVQAAPAIAPKAIPVMLKNSDWPGAMELAKQLEPDQKAGPSPEDAQKAQMLINALTEQVNQLHEQVTDQQADRDSKEKIAQMDNDTKRDIAQIQAQADVEKERARVAFELEKAKVEAMRAVRESELQLEQAKLQPPPQAPHEGMPA
jgi:hypothetical protein